jgi:hypothetical protein
MRQPTHPDLFEQSTTCDAVRVCGPTSRFPLRTKGELRPLGGLGDDSVGGGGSVPFTSGVLSLPVTALSLTMPAVARVFSYIQHSNRTNFFVGAAIASSSSACVHLPHPTLLSPLRSSLGVSHQSSLRSRATTMSCSISLSQGGG